MFVRFACSVSVFLVALATSSAGEMLTPHTMKVVEGTKPATAEMSEFLWLQGQWQGEGFDANCDETWSVPAGDCMVGTFRMVKDGKLVFSEFLMLTKTEKGVVLRLKHFNPDLTGWEEKDKSVDFPLVKIEGRTAWFGGLTYQLQDDGSLKAYVAMKMKDGTHKEGQVHLRRVKTDNRSR